MRLNKTLLTAIATLAVLGCRTDGVHATNPVPLDNTQGIIAGTLHAEVNKEEKRLTLRNSTEFVVGYLVVEKDIATVALFPPCGNNCSRIAQGQSRSMSFAEIVGYTPGAREIRVMWWTYAPGGDGSQPQGGVQTINVRID
jgi:hypothetical protein